MDRRNTGRCLEEEAKHQQYQYDQSWHCGWVFWFCCDIFCSMRNLGEENGPLNKRWVSCDGGNCELEVCENRYLKEGKMGFVLFFYWTVDHTRSYWICARHDEIHQLFYKSTPCTVFFYLLIRVMAAVWMRNENVKDLSSNLNPHSGSLYSKFSFFFFKFDFP